MDNFYSNYLSVNLKNGKFDLSICLSDRSDDPYAKNGGGAKGAQAYGSSDQSDKQID